MVLEAKIEHLMLVFIYISVGMVVFSLKTYPDPVNSLKQRHHLYKPALHEALFYFHYCIL